MTIDTLDVRTSLEKLINMHITDVDLGCIDEIVLSYVCGVVEEVASGDDIDSLGMKDVLSGYIPQFSEVPEDDVESWVHHLAKISMENKGKEKSDKSLNIDSLISFTAHVQKRTSSSSTDVTVRSHSEKSDSSEDSTKLIKEELDPYSESLSLLLEMFPNACMLEAQHCLNTCGGNMENATSLLLERQDQGLSIKKNVSKVTPKPPKLKDEKDIKNLIVNKYGFIDKDDDRREHRPAAPKWEGKKMIRYRDSKIVSLKGERYSEVKKDEEMKKAQVNIKPNKPHKFH